MQAIEYEVARAIVRKVRRFCMAQNRQHRKFPKDLRGMCGIGAAKILEELVAIGHGPDSETAASIAVTSGHCFALVNVLINGETKRHVLDATATQFGQLPIVVKPQAEAQEIRKYGHSFWRVSQEFKERRELVKWQQKAMWPVNEIAL